MDEQEKQSSRVLETHLFKNKNVSNFLEEIYHSIKAERDDIKDLMVDISSLITKDTDEAMIGFLGPVLKDLLDVSVKNNEQLIKLAGTIQRFLTIDNKINTKGQKDSNLLGDQISISDEEKEQLKDIIRANNLVNQKNAEIKSKIGIN